MSGVKLYALCPFNEHGCFSPHMAELHTLPEPENRTAYALASDYAALEAERDELRVQVEAMRAALTPEALDWLRCGLSTNGRLIDGTHPALEKVRAVYAALQAKP